MSETSYIRMPEMVIDTEESKSRSGGEALTSRLNFRSISLSLNLGLRKVRIGLRTFLWMTDRMLCSELLVVEFCSLSIQSCLDSDW